jgi:O-methyltransferase involved in polyketide biosynthesis
MNKEDFGSTERDFSTISPSAAALLLLKGMTNIPFATQAAQLMVSPEKYEPDFSIRDLTFWVRALHFENRYWSIDQLLADTGARNILELSSGFSFRGLSAIATDNIHYIDTDLENIISVKKEFIKQLDHGPAGANSKLEILTLNALDEAAFLNTVACFEPGELVIVNEGLLVYLNTAEKEQLCKIILDILTRRGGYWITADIYIKKELDKAIKADDKLQEFFEQHKIEENKFDDFEEAEAFFNKAGFVIDKEAAADPSKITTLPYLLQSATAEQLAKMKSVGKIHQTWRLKPAKGRL